ncbi:hypothetical protein EV715DRAFT_255220 [Schizophyllum commune]
MSSPLSSTTKKPVRTYKGRSKRRGKPAQDNSDSSSSSEWEDDEKPSAKMPPPATPASKKPEPNFKVPEPKGATPNAKTEIASPAQSKPESAKKKTHVRNSSSISSLRRAAQGSDIASPASLTKPISRSRFAPAREEPDPDPEETDDGASVAESFVSNTKIRRTEAERIEYFRNQPECGEIEPHRAFCTRCNKHVGLGKKQTYTVRPWETHRAKCDQKLPVSMMPGDDEPEDETASVSAATPSEATVRRSEAERKAMLEADTRAEELEPHQALCRKCHKWIKLSTQQRYGLSNWNRHQRSCADAVPSARVSSAQRRVYLCNDKQANDPQPDSVQCKACGGRIALEGDGEYNLSSWQQHKSICSFTSPAGVSAPANATPSVASTDGTLIPDGSPVSQGKKRAREEDHEDEAAPAVPADEDERPTNRPRTENYVAPDAKPPPGPFGWFLELPPVKSFLDGFRERFGGGKTPAAGAETEGTSQESAAKAEN